MRKIIAMLVAVVLLFSLPSCASPEDELVGKWYWEDWNTVYFNFYSDGTCKVFNHYGTGQWSVVDGYLKIVDFYGVTTAYEYSIDGDNLTVEVDGEILVLRKVE